MTTRIDRIILLSIILGMICLTALLVTQKAIGSAPPGLPTSVATTSQSGVSTTATMIFSTSTTCASRIITTRAQPIMLTFSDYAGQTPTGSFGHLQPASTTSVYDSGQYGCGLTKAFGFAADTITVTETR